MTLLKCDFFTAQESVVYQNF